MAAIRERSREGSSRTRAESFPPAALIYSDVVVHAMKVIHPGNLVRRDTKACEKATNSNSQSCCLT